MATTTLYIKYRPIRIGFLIRDSSTDDLIKAAQINTLLWGGIYNPVIPVSSTNINFSKQLLDIFSVDVLYATSHTKEIDVLIKDNPFLRDPSHYAENIFYEDWDTKKNILGYLDTINIVAHYWEKEFKNKPEDFKSDCSLVNWEESDPCNNLFSILFGYISTSLNLKEDFRNAFLKGLRSKVVNIGLQNTIDSSITKSITPIHATALELSGFGGTWRGNGIYVGSSNNFIDLLNFWNLRASGLLIEFFPRDQLQRFDEFIKGYLKGLDEMPNRNPNIEDWICVYYSANHEDVQKVVKEYQGTKRFLFSHCSDDIWNGLNIKPASFYFGSQQTLANVDVSYERYNVSVALPEMKFLNAERNRNVSSQQLVVSVDALSEFAYPGHTLKPPFIRKLNEVYSRSIAFDPWRIRSEKDGIGVIIKAYESSLSLYPINDQILIQKVFELAGFKATTSQAGLLAKQIIQGMKDDFPLEACRVFKITGVRKLLTSPKTARGSKILRSEATKIIWENNFLKFQNLFIETRNHQKLGANEVFDYLVKKKIFAPKLKFIYRFIRKRSEFKCRNCGLKEMILIANYENEWICPYCRFNHFMPEFIGEDFQSRANKYWQFSRSGLFAKDNNQEGAIPVIISLLTFARIFSSYKLFYSTSLNLENSRRCEIDFCILQSERSSNIQIGIAECKSEGQKIDQRDVDNLKAVQDKLQDINLECYIIFAKTADIYDEDEIKLFESLKAERRRFIILSNKELEPYHPYWEMEETERLPEKYALDLAGMERNSLFLYLNKAHTK